MNYFCVPRLADVIVHALCRATPILARHGRRFVSLVPLSSAPRASQSHIHSEKCHMCGVFGDSIRRFDCEFDFDSHESLSVCESSPTRASPSQIHSQPTVFNGLGHSYRVIMTMWCVVTQDSLTLTVILTLTRSHATTWSRAYSLLHAHTYISIFTHIHTRKHVLCVGLGS